MVQPIGCTRLTKSPVIASYVATDPPNWLAVTSSGFTSCVTWMWVTAAVGMATKYSEVTLAQKYREVQEEGAGDSDYEAYLREQGITWLMELNGVRGEMYYVPQPSQLPAAHHATQWVGDRALAFLDATPADQPFYLYASFIHPHPPFAPPSPWHKLYRAPLMPLPMR